MRLLFDKSFMQPDDIIAKIETALGCKLINIAR